VIRVVGGANGRGSLGKGLIKIYERAAVADVIQTIEPRTTIPLAAERPARLQRARAPAIRKQRAMRRVAIVVSLHCASALVTEFADSGLPLPAAAADTLTGLLADSRTDDGNDRVLLSALRNVGLVQQLPLGWPAPAEAWPAGRRVCTDLARAPPVGSWRGPSCPPSPHCSPRGRKGPAMTFLNRQKRLADRRRTMVPLLHPLTPNGR
jgi:hypothetical protein